MKSISASTVESLVLVGLLLYSVSSHAAEPRQITSDGRVKRDPIFVDASGDTILYTVLAKPTQLQLVKISCKDGVATALHPSETRNEFEPAISADGRYLAFVQNRGNLSLALVIEDRVGSESSEVPPGGGFSGMHCPTFVPDGSRILFSYPEEGRQNIFSVDIRGKQRQSVIDSVGVNNWPDVSPDGRTLVFGSSRDDDFEIYSAQIDGRSPKRLTHSPGQDIRPRFSPDGRRIAFTSNRDGNYNLFVMNDDGSNLVRLTDSPEQDDYAQWHPDGKRLAFVGEREGRFDVYVMDLPY